MASPPSPSPPGTNTTPTTPGAVEVVGFTLANARRVAEATLLVENEFRNPVPSQGRPRTPRQLVARLAQTTGAVSAFSGSVLGSGSATLLSISSGSTTSSIPVTIYNAMPSTVASGKTVVVVNVQGYWVIVAAPC